MKKLDRELGLVSVVAIAIGSMVGGGIFVLPGLAAAKTGASVWLAYLLAGLFVIPAALSKSEMATAMPKSGGTYVFVDRSIGPLAGTIVGIGTWLAMLFKASFALVGISVYLSIFTSISSKVVAFSLLALVACLNIVGVKKVGKAQIVVMVICLLSLSLLIIKGFTQLNMAHFKVYFPNGNMGLLATTGLVFISYAGVTKVASIAEEIIEPEKNLPLAMIISLAVMMVLYSLVAFVLVGVVPLQSSSSGTSLAHNGRAIALLGDMLFGPTGRATMAIVAVIALASMANSGLLAASRYPLAMSRDGMLPSIFQRVNERFTTPMVSIIFTASCMAVAITFLPVLKIAKLASGMQVLLFMVINVAVIILRESRPQWYAPQFKSPLYPGMQIFGIIGCFVLLFMLGTFVLVGTTLLLVIGVAWFLLYARHKTKRRGVLQKMRTKSKLLEPDSESEEVAQADLVIPLSGNEHSPEALLHIGSALGAKQISMLNLHEVPDQLALSNAMLDETPHMQALKRRIKRTSRRLHIESNTDFIATHDLRHALFDYVEQSKAPCLLVDMGPHQKFFQVQRYLGWLTSSLPCNLAIYQNEGIDITKSILVLIANEPADLMVVEVANKLAEMYDGSVTLLSVLPEDADEDAVEQAEECLFRFRERCTVPDIRIEIAKGELLPTVVEESILHELLVMGFPHLKPSGWYPTRSPKGRLLKEVACSVLSIRPAQGATQWPLLEQPISLHLPDLLDPRTIRLKDHVENKVELFEHFAQLFSKVIQHPVEELKQALTEGESEDDEILGGGVALLHATVPSLEKTYLGMLLLDATLQSKNKEFTEVDVIVLTIGPAAHIQADKQLRQQLHDLLSDESWLARLREAPDTEGVMRLFRAQYHVMSRGELPQLTKAPPQNLKP